jgi:hypothetical protein
MKSQEETTCIFCNKTHEMIQGGCCGKCEMESRETNKRYHETLEKRFAAKKRKCQRCGGPLNDPRYYFRHPKCHEKFYDYNSGTVYDWFVR